jgi:LAGLIDADG DNA endonuclease family protein
MHPQQVRSATLALIDGGLNDCEVARRTGIPRSTVRDWRRPTYQRKQPDVICPRCWRGTKPIRFTAEEYAEMLGLYLGDGCISPHDRTDRLRVFLDAKYPGIIRDAKALPERCLPQNEVGLVRVHGGTMFVVSLYSSHLICLFPQDGEGKKHERAIVLEAWQRGLVERAPWDLLRGLIRSDGSVFINRTGPYRYLSFHFSNRSKDIIDLLTRACNLVGVEHRVTCWRGLWNVRVNRRTSVALMLAEVGTKA